MSDKLERITSEDLAELAADIDAAREVKLGLITLDVAQAATLLALAQAVAGRGMMLEGMTGDPQHGPNYTVEFHYGRDSASASRLSDACRLIQPAKEG